MPTAPPPLLHTSASFLTVRPTVDTDPSAVWSVVAKCKPYLEHGERLENMAWRLWNHQQPRRRFTQFVSSLSAAHHVRPHEVVQHNTTAPTRHATVDSTTPTLITDRSYDDNEDDDDEDSLYTDDDDDDDDDYYDEDDDSLLFDDDGYEDDEDVDDGRKGRTENPDKVFQKKPVHPKPPARSLLSDMLARQKRPPHPSPPQPLPSSPSHPPSLAPPFPTTVLPAPTPLPTTSSGHRPCYWQELSESVRRNVCREQTSPFCGKLALSNQHSSKHPPTNTSDAAGWLGSFRGW